MMNVHPVQIGDETFIATEVNLPKTKLMSIHTDTGYVMCGALDITLLRNKLADRGIIAARAVGVRTIPELLDGVVESCTQEAERLGIQPGTTIREALLTMRKAERESNQGN